MRERNSAESLELFAIRIEEKLRAAGSSSTIENLVCRALTNKKSPAVAAKMAEKWVEWRYGKAKETMKIEGHLEHTVFDTSKLTDEQLREAERLVESAHVSGDKG